MYHKFCQENKITKYNIELYIGNNLEKDGKMALDAGIKFKHVNDKTNITQIIESLLLCAKQISK